MCKCVAERREREEAVSYTHLVDGTLEIKLSYMDEFVALTKTCEKIRKEVA